MKDLNAFMEFFQKPANIKCQPCLSEKGSYVTEIENKFNEGATDQQISNVEQKTNKELSNFHIAILKVSNGFTLFSQKLSFGKKEFIDRVFGIKNEIADEVGFKLYNTKELLENHFDILELMNQLLTEELSRLDNKESEIGKAINDDIENWLPNILIIGEELMSGNYLALDYSQPKKGEFPVIYLDHETMSMGSEETKELASSIMELLNLIQKDPVNFLNDKLSCITRYSDGKTNEQWIPKEYILL